MTRKATTTKRPGFYWYRRRRASETAIRQFRTKYENWKIVMVSSREQVLFFGTDYDEPVSVAILDGQFGRRIER
jgi:hypothetical protein